MFIINIILICWLWLITKNKTTTPVRLHWLLQSDCKQQEILYAGHGNAGLSGVFFFNIFMPDMLTPDCPAYFP